ncbi:MAG: alanine--glyoxylate aminotransferase family protein [Flavobacteriaceae bacterium]|nr:alanine--glyoxylate aminotransferase family protein [Flavobacteriaceae bacterium]
MKNRKLLMIPGPIEFEPSVLRILGAPTTSHVAANFIKSFGHCIKMMRDVWISPKGQPFIVAGSGTLAMDMAACNLVEPGDKVLVISTGYFGDRYATILERYGAEVTVLEAPFGKTICTETIDKTLEDGDFKILTFTHVDTSTGILVAPKAIGALGKKHRVLTILDGVCSVAGEEILQDAWNIDVVLTASQKAIGVPPGLALLMVSEKAMQVFKTRKTPVLNYYGDFANWLPIMKAYENETPSYFGTPPVNLIMALEESLKLIVAEGMEQRFARHQQIASAFREAMQCIGLTIFPNSNDIAANTLTAVYYPKNISAGDFLGAVKESDIILAGGLLASHKTEYFRVGHMGIVNQSDIIATIAGIEKALKKCGHSFNLGDGLSKALAILSEQG